MGLGRVNLILGALVLALVVGWMASRPAPGPALTDLDPGAIGQIRVSDRRGLKFALARDGADWRLTHPQAGPADPDQAAALAGLARTPSHRQLPLEGLDLQALGLDPPGLRLELDGRVLELGGTDPVQGRRYVLVAGRVHLIADPIAHLLRVPERKGPPRGGEGK